MKHLRTLHYIADVARSGSIRKTAEQCHITPSALTRKIQDFEQELGTAIFERLPQGMRLNAAGELLMWYIRNQTSSFERLRSQIADLSGIRRGHVTVACCQTFAGTIVPAEIAHYRAQFPLVSFQVQVKDYLTAAAALANYEADLALLLHPAPSAETQVIFAYEEPLCALIPAEHPLAQEKGFRLRDCTRYPVALPDHSFAVRHLLDAALARIGVVPNMQIESSSFEFLRDYVIRENVISFQIASGIPSSETTIRILPVSSHDMAPVQIILGQLRGRPLSVAAAKFADQLTGRLVKNAGQ